MLKSLKSTIFSLLPESVQHRIILKKTGFKLLENGYFTNDIKTKMYMPPNQPLWVNRMSKPYGHEPEVVKWYERNLKNSDVVFDIGVHIGYFAILTSKLKPNISFHGFEGNWYNAYYLKLNKLLHDQKSQWFITEKFVGKSDDSKMISIDNYISKKNASPTIFQMDVDGEEINVLSGAKKLLDAATCIFLIEVHPLDLANRKQTTEQFLKIFDSTKYKFRYLANLRADNSFWSDKISSAEMKDEFYLMALPAKLANDYL